VIASERQLLTWRELEVVDLLHLTNREIAERLHLSEHTVKVHVKRIMRKLDARTRSHALLLCVRRGWIVP
jgi:DNA-binding NarL/FixJ family response regulator